MTTLSINTDTSELCNMKNSSPLYIDGISVEVLFDHLYHNYQDIRYTTRYEIITWEPLYVAADREALSNSLSVIADFIREQSQGGTITVRAYPSHDDVCVTFEMTSDTTGYNSSAHHSWKPDRIDHTITTIMNMGGELGNLVKLPNGYRICFWLPQWISVDIPICKVG